MKTGGMSKLLNTAFETMGRKSEGERLQDFYDNFPIGLFPRNSLEVT